MSSRPPWPQRVAAASALLVGAGLVLAVTVHAAHARAAGEDFQPLYLSALAMRLHEPIYQVPGFVYPPLAAVVARPLTAMDLAHAFTVWMAMAAVATVATAAGVAAVITRGRPLAVRWAVTALVMAAWGCSRPWQRSLDLGNISLFWPLVLTGICLLWGRGRWHSGVALLVASLVVKPLLLPLLLVPAVRRRWATLATWGGLAAAATVVALLGSAGVSGVGSAVEVLLGATRFVGREAPLNLSLAGFARVHGEPRAVVDLERLAVVAVTGVVFARWARNPGGPMVNSPTRQRDVFAVATMLAAALFLVSSISEVHYVPILLPGLLVVMTSRERPAAVLAVLAALTYLAAVPSGRDLVTQSLLVSTELLTLLACGVVTARGGGASTLAETSGDPSAGHRVAHVLRE